MTESTDLPPSDLPPADPPPSVPAGPPPARPPLSTASSLGYGCGGFILFFVLAGVVATAVGASSVAGLVVVVVLGGGAVALVRGATPAGRAIFVRAGIGFGIAALLFGGCIAMLSNMSFH